MCQEPCRGVAAAAPPFLPPPRPKAVRVRERKLHVSGRTVAAMACPNLNLPAFTYLHCLHKPSHGRLAMQCQCVGPLRPRRYGTSDRAKDVEFDRRPTYVFVCARGDLGRLRRMHLPLRCCMCACVHTHAHQHRPLAPPLRDAPVSNCYGDLHVSDG